MGRLLRGMARTAVVAGTATHVSNNVSRRQAARYAAEDQSAAPATAAPAPAEVDTYTEIAKLGELKAEGLLTEEEFNAKKAQILGL